MKRKIVVALLSAAMLCGCSATTTASGVDTVINARPSILESDAMAVSEVVTPKVDEFTMADDFSDVLNPTLIDGLDDNCKQMLRTNNFAVIAGKYLYGYMDEYFSVYEKNMYAKVPSFVTSDSLLHTFHLYYAYLQKNTERDYLRSMLAKFSLAMYNNCQAQKKTLAGTDWEDAAQRNVDYYAIALTLLGESVDGLSSTAQQEIAAINAGGSISRSALFSTEEDEYDQDYSQFTPRGYYTESDALQQYFKAMMWFGQMNFSVKQDSLDRSAVLNVIAMKDEALEDWQEVYMITAFFAGESDDNGYYEYKQIMDKAFGSDITADQLADKKDAYDKFVKMAEELSGPKINSVAVYDYEDRDEETKGFRIMGQRFTLDANIMQRLVYREVGENDQGKRRNLPDALDVPAALGSDEAYQILQTTTNVNDFPDYEKNLNTLKSTVKDDEDEIYSSCISQGWLGSLSPLLETKGEGYPKFMQNTAWADKDLNTYLGSYTELKHDTVLYAKQIMSEMGGVGGVATVPPDDRGYVEPEPVLYEKIKLLSQATMDGLKQRNLISAEDETFLQNLIDMSDKLETISNKELTNELPSDDEFEFIRSYGGQLEHLWTQTIKTANQTKVDVREHPAALVTDIATDGSTGDVLQLGTGSPDIIYVIVNFGGHPRICRGSVYSYYEFTSASGTRMTDEQWRKITGTDAMPARPTWVSSFFSTSTMSNFKKGVKKTYYYLHVSSDTTVYFNADASTDVMGTALAGKVYQADDTAQVNGQTWYHLADHQWVVDNNTFTVSNKAY